ncbi:MAG: nucleotide exchange factor GrpE [Methanobacteriaceae archaeon]|nr:nucleotide exchange factor GrpE [Methanobacteriaceae archaeon]
MAKDAKDLKSDDIKESEDETVKVEISDDEIIDDKSKTPETESSKEDEELAKLKEDLSKSVEENTELKSHLQRLQADFENFRRQTDRQKEDLVKYANEKLIMNFIDVYEDMERVLTQSTNDEELKEGYELIYSKMKNSLEKEGLEVIPTEGEKFDINKHEALLVQDSPDHENNEIVTEVMKGYTLKDKVIKYSKVVVCKKKTPKKEE